MNEQPERRRDLDFYRGFTVVQMVAAHLLMYSRSPMRPDETVRLFFLGYAEIFSAGFLMLAGINVDRAIRNAEADPRFNLSRFYFLTSLGLFFMGWSYNLLEGTGPYTSVVQAIGIGVLVTYLVLRVGFPNWSLPIVAGLFLVNYYLAIGSRLTIDPGVHSHFFWNLLIGNGMMTKAGLANLWPAPYLFCMFGIIPTSGFVLLGVFIERLKGKALFAACVLFTAMAIVSHFMPGLAFNNETHTVLRADMKFLMQILPLYTGWLLTFRYLYPKTERTKIKAAVERFGRLSLDFLIFHWIFIVAVTLFTPFLEKMPSFSARQIIRAIVVLFLLYLVLPRFDAWRRRVSQKPHFLLIAWGLLLGGFLVCMLAILERVFLFKALGAGLAAVVFALMYPAQRESWRKSSFRKAKVDT